MKYKTLVMKQIDRHTYQYSMNAPLDNLSSILSFDEEILKYKKKKKQISVMNWNTP